MNDPNPEPTKPEEPTSGKKRSPIERMIVWGVILVLLLVVYFEWRARSNYTESLKSITAVRQESEMDPSLPPAKLSDLDKCVVGSPARIEGKAGHLKTVLYRWKGLTGFRTYTILLTLEGGDVQDPMLLALETDKETSSAEEMMSESPNFDEDAYEKANPKKPIEHGDDSP